MFAEVHETALSAMVVGTVPNFVGDASSYAIGKRSSTMMASCDLIACHSRTERRGELACGLHSEGHAEESITVQTCWDADRLDLGCIGICPAARYLCTEVSKCVDVIAAAFQCSMISNSTSDSG